MEQKTGFFEPGWRPAQALVLGGFGILMLISLLVPAGNAAWRSLDEAVFLALNGTLAGGGDWAVFWAWANYRPVDLLSACMMLAFLALPGLVFEPDEVRRALFGFFSILLLGLIVREVLDASAEHYGVVGPSPSLIFEPSYRLTELVPGLDTKDSSKESFPGDHASVLMAWAMYLLNRRVGPGSLLACVLAALLVLPRLVAGAHALSDVLVGGVFVAFLAMSLGFCTPYHGRAARWVTARFEPLIAWMARSIPGLRWFSFFRVSGNE